MSEPSYKNLKSYQQATAVYDFTVEFCGHYINSKSRTVDQMEQAARSGKQNIVEGSAASRNSPMTELKLVGVARASLEELLEDYADFLRQHNFEIWGKDDPRTLEVRQLAYRTDRTYTAYKTYMTYKTYKSYLVNPEKAANAMITLINQTNYLLDQQMKAIKLQMESKGIAAEPKNQRQMRLKAEEIKKNQEFDAFLKGFLKKNNGQENK
jgi:four helix bundle protein